MMLAFNKHHVSFRSSPQVSLHFFFFAFQFCFYSNFYCIIILKKNFFRSNIGLPVFPYDCSASNQSDTSLMITCEHTSNSNNLDQNLFNNNEDDSNGDLTANNEDNLIMNNSLHNVIGRQSNGNSKPFSTHSHNSNLDGNLKAKSPASLFIYPNLIYICEVYKGNRLMRNVSTTLNGNRRHNSTTHLLTYLHGKCLPLYQIDIFIIFMNFYHFYHFYEFLPLFIIFIILFFFFFYNLI